ncbi:hypothetical protein FHT09_000540 [Xanthomonas arboricola]|nr:hypothetical protein [Xanthomonas sp. CFBP 8152]
MSLQLSASVEGHEHAVLTVLADPQDESLWVELLADGTQVQIPLAVLHQLLEVAAEEVHSADWFARQDAGDPQV